MNKSFKKALLVSGICLPVLIVGALAYRFCVTPDPHFVCHKALWFAVMDWQKAAGNDQWYPNIEGDGGNSLKTLVPYLSSTETNIADYRYVPGLKRDDPDELIMLYLARPSMRTWHGDWPIRLRKQWIAIGPSWMPPFNSPYESHEHGVAVPAGEFKRRLRLTLDYLRANSRTNWAATVKEHEAFLKSVPD